MDQIRVEGIHAELRRHSLIDRHVLEDGHIAVEEVRSHCDGRMILPPMHGAAPRCFSFERISVLE
jgi:hypothetical protein